MPSEYSQHDSQPIRQNNDSVGVLPNLNDSDVRLLVEFFQLLAEWDRQ